MKTSTREDILSYYRQSGPLSTLPDSIRPEMLPDNLDDLVKVVQGVIVHIFWAERYGLQLSPARKEEVNLRSFAEKLPVLFSHDSSPITTPRPLEKRLVGNCRDFSNFLASFLRLKGIPARARCGFGAYFMPGTFEDHWVSEFWNQAEERWRMVDAQLDALQKETLEIHFDTLNVPTDQFITGGKAWLQCRSGQADPEKFGIFDMRGLDFIRGDLIRDFLALNRQEILPWDSFGLIDKPASQLSGKDMELLDHIAGLTLQPEDSFAEIRTLAETHAELKVPSAWMPIK